MCSAGLGLVSQIAVGQGQRVLRLAEVGHGANGSCEVDDGVLGVAEGSVSPSEPVLDLGVVGELPGQFFEKAQALLCLTVVEHRPGHAAFCEKKGGVDGERSLEGVDRLGVSALPRVDNAQIVRPAQRSRLEGLRALVEGLREIELLVGVQDQADIAVEGSVIGSRPQRRHRRRKSLSNIGFESRGVDVRKRGSFDGTATAAAAPKQHGDSEQDAYNHQ